MKIEQLDWDRLVRTFVRQLRLPKLVGEPEEIERAKAIRKQWLGWLLDVVRSGGVCDLIPEDIELTEGIIALTAIVHDQFAGNWIAIRERAFEDWLLIKHRILFEERYQHLD